MGVVRLRQDRFHAKHIYQIVYRVIRQWEVADLTQVNGGNVSGLGKVPVRVSDGGNKVNVLRTYKTYGNHQRL